MNNRSNHKKKKLVLRPDHSVEGTSFEGIIPDTETLKELEQIVPGSTKQWQDLAKHEIESRQKNESRITWTYMVSTITGQVFGFLSSAIICYIGYFAISLGHPATGATIITGSAASVIAAYIFKSKQNKD